MLPFMAVIEPLFDDDDEPALIPNPPETLGADGIALWHRIWTEYDLSDAPDKIEILANACAHADWVAKLEIAAREKPIRSKGSAGQPVVAPEIQELRAYRSALIQALKSLRLESVDDDDESGDGPLSRHAVAKLGAKARWGYRSARSG